VAFAGSSANRILFSAERVDLDAACDRICRWVDAGCNGESDQDLGNALHYRCGDQSILNGFAKGAGSLEPARVQEITDHASESEDYLETRRAFLEKRWPVFRGR